MLVTKRFTRVRGSPPTKEKLCDRRAPAYGRQSRPRTGFRQILIVAASHTRFPPALDVFEPQSLAVLRLVRECAPGGLGSAETLAHMLKCRCIPLDPPLLDASEEEVNVRAA
jgi:hypothetical protein